MSRTAPWLTLLAMGSVLSVARAAPPVTPDASAPARCLVQILGQASGHAILTGQHDYLEDPETFAKTVAAATGHSPAIHGYELGAIMGQTDYEQRAQRHHVIDSALAWHAQGGIVAMTYHERFPGLCACWASVQRTTTQAEFDSLLTAGTPGNTALLADLDAVSEQLAMLRDKGVPVLWRPYHEMNGDWFWWGGKQDFARLWALMFDRLAVHHRLDNLVWVWSPNAPGSGASAYEASFPAADQVDVLALDQYDASFPQAVYDRFAAFARGKPIALGETGALPAPELLATRQGAWVWNMSWGKMIRENNTEAAIRSFYDQPRAIDRDGLAALRREGC